MTAKVKIIRQAQDVTDHMLVEAVTVSEWWGEDERIDWEQFIDKLADVGLHEDPPWDFEEYDNAAIRKIQKHVRYERRA